MTAKGLKWDRTRYSEVQVIAQWQLLLLCIVLMANSSDAQILHWIHTSPIVFADVQYGSKNNRSMSSYIHTAVICCAVIWSTASTVAWIPVYRFFPTLKIRWNYYSNLHIFAFNELIINFICHLSARNDMKCSFLRFTYFTLQQLCALSVLATSVQYSTHSVKRVLYIWIRCVHPGKPHF